MFNRRFVMDMFERAAMTFVQAFLAVFLVVDFSSADLSTGKTAIASAVAAGLAAVKAMVASQVGKPGSAALLNERSDP